MQSECDAVAGEPLVWEWTTRGNELQIPQHHLDHLYMIDAHHTTMHIERSMYTGFCHPRATHMCFVHVTNPHNPDRRWILAKIEYDFTMLQRNENYGKWMSINSIYVYHMVLHAFPMSIFDEWHRLICILHPNVFEIQLPCIIRKNESLKDGLSRILIYARRNYQIRDVFNNKDHILFLLSFTITKQFRNAVAKLRR